MSHAQLSPISNLQSQMPRPDSTAELTAALEKRILVLDGAMGTTIRGYGLTEKEARGDRFKDTEKDILNNIEKFVNSKSFEARFLDEIQED